WRAGQCKREEAAALLATARTAASKPGAKPEELAVANKAVETHTDAIRDAAENFQVQAEQIGMTAGGSEAHLRMLYEAAWCYRLLADAETDAARLKAQRDAQEKAKAGASSGRPPQSADPAAIPSAPSVQRA